MIRIFRINMACLALRFGFAAILIIAAWSKILNPFEFAENVVQYRVLPLNLSLWVAVFIPFLEAVLAFLFITGFYRRTAVWINGLLMFGFWAMVMQAFFRGLDINCGCFTQSGESPIDLWKIGENSLFLILSVVFIWLVVFYKKK